MQVSSIGVPDSFSTMTQETLDSNVQPDNLLASGEAVIDDIYTQQEFMNSIVNNMASEKISSDSLLAYQSSMEQFSLETKVVSKTVSVAVQGIQTLVQLQ